jgi:hypothetical protein
MVGAMLEYLYDAWAVSLTNLLNAGVEWRRYKIKPIRATHKRRPRRERDWTIATRLPLA